MQRNLVRRIPTAGLRRRESWLSALAFGLFQSEFQSNAVCGLSGDSFGTDG